MSWVRYEYAPVRVVPRVERGEFVNAGVVVFCRARRYLGARVELGPERERALVALAPGLDLDALRERLAAIPLVCAGGPGSGPIGQLTLAERFHWVVAPQSTVVQAGPVHTGICTDPAAVLARTYDALVGVGADTGDRERVAPGG